MALTSRFSNNPRFTEESLKSRFADNQRLTEKQDLINKLRIKLIENPDTKFNIPGILELGFEEPYDRDEVNSIVDTVLSKLNGELRFFSDADPKEARDTSRKNLLGMNIKSKEEACGKECGSFLDIDCITDKIINKCPGSSGFCDFLPFPGCEEYWTYLVIGGVVVITAFFMLK